MKKLEPTVAGYQIYKIVGVNITGLQALLFVDILLNDTTNMVMKHLIGFAVCVNLFIMRRKPHSDVVILEQILKANKAVVFIATIAFLMKDIELAINLAILIYLTLTIAITELGIDKLIGKLITMVKSSPKHYYNC